MTRKAPGKSHREGISLIELTEMFPDEESAVKWFEAIHWPEERHCGHCGSTETSEVPKAKPMPYWCKGCRSYFSVRTGTTMEEVPGFPCASGPSPSTSTSPTSRACPA